MEPFRNRRKTVFANLSQASTEASRAPKGVGEGVTRLFKDTGTVAPSHVPHAGNSKHKSWCLPSLSGNCPREIHLRNKSAPAQGNASRECGDAEVTFWAATGSLEFWPETGPVCSLLNRGVQRLPALLHAVDLKWSPWGVEACGPGGPLLGYKGRTL